jgi:hypothetical protein
MFMGMHDDTEIDWLKKGTYLKFNFKKFWTQFFLILKISESKIITIKSN